VSTEEREPQPTEDDDLDIETIGYFETPLAERPDPRRDPSLTAVPIGRPRGEPSVFVHADAMDQITDHVGGETKNEVGGVLVGSFYLSRDKRVTDVRHALPAPKTRAGVSHVTFSHDTWDAIFDQVTLGEGESIVGWYHSHPGFGIFLSKQDIFIQEYFFDNDGHIALVVDPVRHAAGCFKWYEGSVVAADGFWVSAAADNREQAVKYGKMMRYKIAHGTREPRGWLRRLTRR